MAETDGLQSFIESIVRRTVAATLEELATAKAKQADDLDVIFAGRLLIPEGELQSRLGWGHQELPDMRRRQQIPHRRFRGRIFYTRRDVAALLGDNLSPQKGRR